MPIETHRVVRLRVLSGDWDAGTEGTVLEVLVASLWSKSPMKRDAPGISSACPLML